MHSPKSIMNFCCLCFPQQLWHSTTESIPAVRWEVWQSEWWQRWDEQRGDAPEPERPAAGQETAHRQHPKHQLQLAELQDRHGLHPDGRSSQVSVAMWGSGLGLITLYYIPITFQIGNHVQTRRLCSNGLSWLGYCSNRQGFCYVTICLIRIWLPLMTVTRKVIGMYLNQTLVGPLPSNDIVFKICKLSSGSDKGIDQCVAMACLGLARLANFVMMTSCLIRIWLPLWNVILKSYWIQWNPTLVGTVPSQDLVLKAVNSARVLTSLRLGDWSMWQWLVITCLGIARLGYWYSGWLP